MYNERVIKEFSNPQNVGEMKDANAVGTVGNATCGDIMKIFMKINDDGVIEDVSFQTFGCGAAIATSSVATSMIKGKTVDEALKITNQQVVDELGGFLRKNFTVPYLPRRLLRLQSTTTLQTTKNKNNII